MIEKLPSLDKLLEDNHQSISAQIAKKVNEIIDIVNEQLLHPVRTVPFPVQGLSEVQREELRNAMKGK